MSTIGGPDIIEDGLVLYLDAANTKSYPGSGTNWFDRSLNSYNASLINSPTYIPNSHFSFDGVDDYSTINNLNLYLPPTENRTLEIWARVDSLPAIQGGLLAGQKNTTGALMVLSNGKFSWYWDDSAAVQSTTTLSLNSWYQIVLVLRDSYYCTYYVNGELDLSEFRTNDTASSQVTVWSMGRQNRNFTGEFYYLNCAVSIHRQYNRLLSASEILQNFNATRVRYGL
jgi:hypothetical protein